MVYIAASVDFWDLGLVPLLTYSCIVEVTPIAEHCEWSRVGCVRHGVRTQVYAHPPFWSTRSAAAILRRDLQTTVKDTIKNIAPED